jgi:hypothetical protein
MGRRRLVLTVTGEMSQELRATFADLELSVEHGVTRVRLVTTDPSALHGVLHRLSALGLDLLDVRSDDHPVAGEADSLGPARP